MATRQLLILRHAKSSWDEPELQDHDRGLAQRGVKALPKIRRHLEESGHQPDLVLCSSARRARETMDGIMPALSDTAEILIEPAIYFADAEDLVERLRAVDGTAGCVLLIGHNPALQDLAILLATSGEEDNHRQLAEKLPTGAVVTLSISGPWSDIGQGAAQLADLFLPRRH